MTRDEAARILENRHWNNPLAFVDSLEALGLLKLETTADKDRIAAAGRLVGMYTVVDVNMAGANRSAKITEAGAYEILDILTKSGFKITREPT
jgi:hypothetical protein